MGVGNGLLRWLRSSIWGLLEVTPFLPTSGGIMLLFLYSQIIVSTNRLLICRSHYIQARATEPQAVKHFYCGSATGRTVLWLGRAA